MAASEQASGARQLSAFPRLQTETGAWNTRANRRKTCIRWTFTRKKARPKFGYTVRRFKRSET